ncbi:MAG: DUF2442 domain-containing protein [Chitinophagaceae bacterium]
MADPIKRGLFVRKDMIKPARVTALPEYKIKVLFEDGTEGVIDLSTFMGEGIFTSLRDENIFKKVYVTKSSIAWSDELEIDAGTIYAEIKQKTPKELFHSLVPYATN